jgi:BirA family biotin operon repressor/biotin-[acetyl-CoA-carboxylase] ligase
MTDEFSARNFFAEWNDFLSAEFSFCKKIDSTNSELLRRAEKIMPFLEADGSVSSRGKKFNFCTVAAESQTNGRGRVGRVFVSPEKTGIYFSFAWVKKNGIENPASATISSAVGICRALEKIFGVQCKIKWVNDIYSGSKKIAGILTEGVMNPQSGKIECAVVGIGINIFTGEEFSDELKKKARGIADGLGVNVSRVKILSECLKEIFSILQSGEEISAEYKKRLFILGKRVDFFPAAGGQKKFSAVARDVTKNGELIVQGDDGNLVALNSGEVTMHAESE